MSDAVELDDCRFHQCVSLANFDADRTISFIPPDGEFELMRLAPTWILISLWSYFFLSIRYRATSNVKLPLRLIPSVTEVGTSQVQYTVIVKASFNNKLSATDIVVRIPTPLNTTTTDCRTQTGKAKYTPSENVIVWKWEGSTTVHFTSDWPVFAGLQGYKVVKNAQSAQQLIWRGRLHDKSGLDHLLMLISRYWCSRRQDW